VSKTSKTEGSYNDHQAPFQFRENRDTRRDFGNRGAEHLLLGRGRSRCRFLSGRGMTWGR